MRGREHLQVPPALHMDRGSSLGPRGPAGEQLLEPPSWVSEKSQRLLPPGEVLIGRLLCSLSKTAFPGSSCVNADKRPGGASWKGTEGGFRCPEVRVSKTCLMNRGPPSGPARLARSPQEGICSALCGAVEGQIQFRPPVKFEFQMNKASCLAYVCPYNIWDGLIPQSHPVPFRASDFTRPPACSVPR